MVAYYNKIHKFLFLLAELSLTAVPAPPRNNDIIRDVRFYADLYGIHYPLIDGVHYHLADDEHVVYGVHINGIVRPIFDEEGRQVVVRLDNNHNIVMTPELKRYFAPKFLWAHAPLLDTHPRTQDPHTQGPHTQSPRTQAPHTQGPRTQDPRIRSRQDIDNDAESSSAPVSRRQRQN